MDCLGESSVLPISTPERSVMQTTRARSFVTQEEYFGGCLREKLRENGTSSELHNAGPMDTGLLSSLVPFVLWIGGTFCWWGLRGRLWYRSTRHLWPCFLVASPFGGLNVPKLPPHDKQWCCFRASPGSRKYKAVRVAPCFPENPCAVCGKACGLTDRELDRQRHPCGLGCGCRCACIGCKYTNAGECERVLCEDTVPEDVVGNTVTSVAAGGLSAIATALGRRRRGWPIATGAFDAVAARVREKTPLERRIGVARDVASSRSTVVETRIEHAPRRRLYARSLGPPSPGTLSSPPRHRPGLDLGCASARRCARCASGP